MLNIEGVTCMGIRERISKASVANVVAGTGVILGLLWGMYSGNRELVSFIVGACVTYLLKKTVREND